MERYGRVDALINNAGIAVFKPVLETTFEEWSWVWMSILVGPFFVPRLCTLMLSGGGGAIVNVTSISGARASTLRVAYGTSKAALV